MENRVEEDALQIRNVNRLLALETPIGAHDWSVSEVPAKVWQAINDLQDKMSRKASEKDLEDVLEFMNASATSKPGERMGVQFQTPRRNPDAIYEHSSALQLSGREMLEPKPQN